MSRKTAKHPNLYEINTRVLVNSYSTKSRRATLSDIPDSYWTDLADRNIDWIWLMGIWKLCEKKINPDLIPEDMMSEFKTLLPDLTDDDIDGSTYAIDDYEVDPVLGGEEELVVLRDKLHDLGIRLMLDYIPNHYGAHTKWLKTFPEYFITVGETAFNIDQLTFYSPLNMPGKYFAHGKDPYFEAWQDTVQVDYSFDGTREWMTDQLLRVARLCDGVRCDMAMLPVKRIFQETWGNYVKWNGGEFWPMAIQAVKENYPEFVTLAEVYWDMEAELLDLGFDYCYDKTFYDRLVDPEALKAHYNADTWYLERTARFLENHDEQRIARKLGLGKHMAAAALVAFSPGMRFWHMGQWDGAVLRTPVQLNRRPEAYCHYMLQGDITSPSQTISTFYKNLLQLSDREVFRTGHWERLETPVKTADSLFIWKWSDKKESITVLINFNEEPSKFDVSTLKLDAKLFEKPLYPSREMINGQLSPWEIRLYRS